MESKPRTFRRGETILQIGAEATHVWLVQSGLVSVSVPQAGKAQEIAQVGAGQVLGEEALWGAKRWGVTAIANNDVRALPVEAKQIIVMLGSGTPLVQTFLRGLIQKQKTWSHELELIRGESDATPCPPARVTQLFAVIHQAATYTGTFKKNAWVVVWPTFKKYCQRTFLESPVRLEAAVYILVKLGIAELEMIPCETDPEAPDELGFVHFKDIDKVRDFYRFYRSYYFSANRQDTAPESGDTDDASNEFNASLLREIAAWNKLGRVDPPVIQDEEAA